MPSHATKRARLGTLFLSLHRPRAAWLTTALLFFSYVASMSRDLGLFDSAELALVAYQLGLGHPIGQPLHTLLGFAFAHVPFIPPLIGLNLFSALCGALCVMPAAAIAERLCHDEAPSTTSALVLHAALFTTGMHAAVWEPSTRIEVYALGAVLALWSVAFTWQALEDGTTRARRLLAAGVGFGLSACASPYTALLAALAVTPWCLGALQRRKLTLRAALAALAGGLAALALYAYVPLVARRRDVLVWGAPYDTRALVHYFSGADFQHNRAIAGHEWFAHVFSWFSWCTQQWLLPLLLIGSGGYLVARGSMQRALIPALSVLLTVALITSNAVFSPDVPDYLGYLLVPIWLCGAGTAAFATLIGARAHQALCWLLLFALSIASVFSQPGWFVRTRVRDHFARAFATAALHEAPAGAIVVAETDQLVAATLYLQLVERQRSDVVILAAGLASSSWYWQQTFARHPDLSKIPLVGPGGRYGRMRRLFDANPSRPVLFERLALARQTQMTACPGGHLLQSGASCAEQRPPDLAAARLFERTLTALGQGSPNTASAVALASFSLGEALFERGQSEAAIAMLVAGAPPSMRPRGLAHTTSSRSIDSSPRHMLTPAWRRTAALGDPARNLFMAGLIALEAGRSEQAAELIAYAAADGLPEALDLLENGRDP